MEHRFHTGEITLNYTLSGSDTLPPLVLLHRLTSRWQSWEDYLAPLSARWRVYALDLRGHGLSDHPPEGYRAIDYARDVSAFLQGCVKDPAVLLGHSGGALAAMLAAARYPKNATGLLLSEPPLYLLHDPVEAEPASYEWFSMVESVQAQGMPVEAIAALLRERFPRVRPGSAAAAARAISRVHPGVPRAALSGDLVSGFDLAEILPRIDCPVTFIQGEKALGAALWDEDIQRIRSLLPRAQIHKFSGAGHNTTSRVREMISLLELMA